MMEYPRLYIDGQWTTPIDPSEVELVDPTREETFARVTLGGAADADRAVAAARHAFADFSTTSVEERISLIDRIIDVYERYIDDFSELIAREVGIPISSRAQVIGPAGAHEGGSRRLARVRLRVADRWRHRAARAHRGLRPDLAVELAGADGSESSHLRARRRMHGRRQTRRIRRRSAPLASSSVGRGRYATGRVQLGIGRDAWWAGLIGAPGVDMISFTGSTSAGIKVGEAAARHREARVLELGGKSANIVLEDADLEKAARWNVQRCFFNTGQSCHAPSRMLVHESQMNDVVPYLVDEVGKYRLGVPHNPDTTMGPVVSKAQFDTVQRYIQIGLDEGGRMVCGGLGTSDALAKGYFTKPTVFVDVAPDMTIAKEEIFGPVLAVIPYSNEDEALRIANESPYGLGGYVFAGDRAKGLRIRKRIARGAGLLQRRGHQLADSDGRLQAVRHRTLDGRMGPRGIPRGEVALRVRGGGGLPAELCMMADDYMGREGTGGR